MKQSDSETESPIPYKYKDADNKVYKDIVLKNDKGELSEDVSQDQSVISKKNKKNKNVNLDELTDEEIQDLITEKIQYIQKIGNKNQSLQRKLNSALKKLNEKILISSEMLYKKETNSTELQWLKDQLENKKNILNTEKRINHSYKVQYNILENKLKARNNRKESKKNIENDNNNNISVSQTLKKTHSTKSLSINKTTQVSSSLYMSIEDEINKIKNENKELITKINDIKKTKVSQKKDVDDIINGELEYKLKIKLEELQQFNMMKMECEDKYNTLNKSMLMAKEKIEHFDKKAKLLENKNELIQKDKLEIYFFWMNLIKKEINNSNLEKLIDMIKNDKSEFLKEVNKVRKKLKKKKSFINEATDMNKDNSELNENMNEKNKKNNNKIINIYSIFSTLNNNLNNNNIIKNENSELEKLMKDQNIYNLINENEYRQLLNKKEEYFETNIRLDKNIENFTKTENNKYSKISKAIKEKIVQLKLVKEKNKLIQEEVNNMENIYQLSLEKESIKKEINNKMNFKQNKNNVEKVKNYINKNINDTNENKKENTESSVKQNSIEEISNKEDEKDDFPSTRDEQLKMIRKKYMDDEDNDKNIINKNIENMENNEGNEINELNNDNSIANEQLNEQKILNLEKHSPFKV